MYSRAERKFLNPEKDQANPLLGPGCYTMDETVLVTGKLFGKSGYVHTVGDANERATILQRFRCVVAITNQQNSKSTVRDCGRRSSYIVAARVTCKNYRSATSKEKVKVRCDSDTKAITQIFILVNMNRND